jgi:hypothetical protein
MPYFYKPSEHGRVSGGMRKCRCDHIFFEHGPKGCTKCDCVSVRGGLFAPDAPVEDVLSAMGIPEPEPDP